MNATLFAILTIACLSSAVADSSSPSAPQIIDHLASSEIFPESWLTSKINAQAQPLAESERERARQIVERALTHYPADLLAATLKKIYLLGRLEYSGAVTAGTRSKSAIYLVCRPSYSSFDFERILHAEYSSILFHQFPQHFDHDAWHKLNPPDFKYLGGGVQAVRSGKSSRHFDDALQEQGFLHQYAQASIEEDFNSHAARLLIGDAAYWQAVERHPKLKAKSDFVSRFYANIHPHFTPATLQAFRHKANPPTTDKSQLTLADIFTDKTYDDQKLETLQWSQLGDYYFTLEKPSQGKEGKDLVKHDAATGKRSILISAKQFIPKSETKPLIVSDFSFSKDEQKLLLFTNTKKVWRKNTRGDYWLIDLKFKTLQKLGGEAPASTLMFAKFSPDGSRVAYLQQNNLFVQKLADLSITQLTQDGNEELINGTSDWVTEEELGLRDAFRWSPDGSHLLFWQFDTREVKRFTLVNQTDSTYPILTHFPYPKAGETNSAVRLGVLPVTGGAPAWLKIPGDPRQHYLPAAEWTPDGQQILVQQFNRLQNTLIVMLADPRSGNVKPLLTETDPAWVENKNSDLRWLGQDFLWFSERSGWRRLYRVTLEGKTQAITPKGVDVIELTKLDPKGGSLYYLASPENATQRYLYRTNLDGIEPQRLSPADQLGTHSYNISPNAAWAVHTSSSFASPPVIQLVSLPKHQTIRPLVSQQPLKEKLARLDFPQINFLRLDAGEGLKFDAWIMHPKKLHPTSKHPLLMHVYGEPAGQTVKDAWGGQRMLWHAMLAQQGYIVASVDTRGTPAPKGRDWRKAVYRQLGILNAQEQANATRALLQRFDFIDPQRVGIWGWSGGGSSSLDALFRYPNLYRTAIAVAPVADRRLYDSIYEERYMGLPADNQKGYTEGSPLHHAAHLKGHLLIIHGTGDDNVHYQGVEKLINELVALNKPFTVMPYPNRDHSINTGKGTSRHLYELMTHYLKQRLPIHP